MITFSHGLAHVCFVVFFSIELTLKTVPFKNTYTSMNVYSVEFLTTNANNHFKSPPPFLACCTHMPAFLPLDTPVHLSR